MEDKKNLEFEIPTGTCQALDCLNKGQTIGLLCLCRDHRNYLHYGTPIRKKEVQKAEDKFDKIRQCFCMDCSEKNCVNFNINKNDFFQLEECQKYKKLLEDN